MFSRKDQLLRKTGPDGVGRYDFLRLLKKEYQETKNQESKEQTLANLANFCYDPINFGYIRDLHIIDLFLGVLNSSEETLVRYAIAGICNLSSDPENRAIILRGNGVQEIVSVLTLENEDILLDGILTLISLRVELPAGAHRRLEQLRKSGRPRLSNLVRIFVENGGAFPAHGRETDSAAIN